MVTHVHTFACASTSSNSPTSTYHIPHPHLLFHTPIHIPSHPHPCSTNHIHTHIYESHSHTSTSTSIFHKPHPDSTFPSASTSIFYIPHPYPHLHSTPPCTSTFPHIHVNIHIPHTTSIPTSLFHTPTRIHIPIHIPHSHPYSTFASTSILYRQQKSLSACMRHHRLYITVQSSFCVIEHRTSHIALFFGYGHTVDHSLSHFSCPLLPPPLHNAFI